MATSVELLLDWMDHAFAQEGWHVSLLESLNGVTARQAAWTPAPERNSIWKNVEHIALWKEEGARRLRGEPPRPAGWAQEHDWMDIGEVSEARWQAGHRRLVDAHAAVRTALQALSDADLNVAPHGYSVSHLAIARGLILHDSYHCGQICYLRALQGIPAKIW